MTNKELIYGPFTSTQVISSNQQLNPKPQIFQQIFKRSKLRNKVNHFIANISRNNIYSKPVNFSIQHKEQPYFSLKGLEINKKLENLILLLDILFTLITFFISSFEAFLPQFQDYKSQHIQVSIIHIISAIIFGASMMISLVAKQVQNGVKYYYITEIVKKQIVKGRFFIELALIIIIILNIAQDPSNDLQTSIILGVAQFLVCICKLFIFSHSLNKVELLLVNNLSKERYWNLTKVFLFNLIYAHFQASIFLALLKMVPFNNWYGTKTGMTTRNPPWLQQYLWAYYYSVTVMVTIGFGDITPQVASEAIVIAFLEIISCIIVAYNISQIGSIVSSINQRNRQINSKIGLLRRMNQQNKVSPQLNLIIEEYLEHELTISEEFEYSKHRSLIAKLPQQLQKSYYGEAQKNIFHKLPFFINLSSQTLTQLYLQFKGRVYYPGEFIVKLKFSQELVIVLKGEIGLCYRKANSQLNESVIEKLKVNYSKDRPMLLGKNVLNKNEGVYFDMKATKYSYGIQLGMDQFLKIIRKNEIDYHFYLMQLDGHQGDSSLAYSKCQYCPYSYHTKFECPKLHFMPLKSMILARLTEYKSSNNYQQRLFSNRFLRKQKSKHIYLHRASEIGNFQFHKDNSSEQLFQLLQSVFSEFGKKKLINHHSSKDLFKTRLSLFRDDAFDQQDYFQVDLLANFNHYFPQSNPSKLIKKITVKRKTTLNKSKRKHT